MTTAETSHIQACRNAWNRHVDLCTECQMALASSFEPGCDQGRAALSEFIAAIKTHPELEQIEAAA